MRSVFRSEDPRLPGTGRSASIALAVSTIVTFAIAMIAIPISGSNAPEGSQFAYPFLNALGQFPRDFIRQHLALLQILAFLSSALVLASFVAITALYGLGKQGRFEVAAIAIEWITLIVAGFMASRLFRREGMK